MTEQVAKYENAGDIFGKIRGILINHFGKNKTYNDNDFHACNTWK